MSVHIHIPLSDLFKMATASTASSASASSADGVAAAKASDAAATARLAQEVKHQQEIKELTAKFQEQIKALNLFHLQSGKHYERRAEEDQEVIHKAEEWLEEAARSEENAQKRANAAEESVRELKTELERMNARAEEVACEKKAAYNELASRFDDSTTFYKMKLEEADEIRARLEKKLKEEEETLEEVSKRECTLGQRVREATLRAEKVEANFLRLCGAIDITLKDFPQYRKKLWDHYMLTAPSCGEMDVEFDDPVPFVPTTAK